MLDEWTYLTRKSSEKGEKLKEANRQRMYTAAVKDLEFWLGEVSLNIFNFSVGIIQFLNFFTDIFMQLSVWDV